MFLSLSDVESGFAMALAGARVACLFVSGLRGFSLWRQRTRPGYRAMSTDPADTSELRAELVRDEGLRARPYADTAGNLTIGVGRNLDAIGLRPDEIALLLTNDITEAITGLDTGAAWWRQLDTVRGRVLINMTFNLGWAGLAEFHAFLAAMQAGDWVAAGAAMQASRWWGQVGARAARLQAMVLTGAAEAPAIAVSAAPVVTSTSSTEPAPATVTSAAAAAVAAAAPVGTWQDAPVAGAGA